MGSLIPMLTAWPTYKWRIGHGSLRIQHGTGGESDAQIRRDLRDIAAAAGLEYVETEEAGYTEAAARGVVDGVPVHIFNHLSRSCGHPAEEPPAARPSHRTPPVVAPWLALGRLMEIGTGIRVPFWAAVSDGLLDVHVSRDDAERDSPLREFARRVGAECIPGATDARGVRMEVHGTLDGVPYRLWTSLNNPCEHEAAAAAAEVAA
jgi:hypothetical protein